jgi:hypothetical protein
MARRQRSGRSASDHDCGITRAFLLDHREQQRGFLGVKSNAAM